MEECHVMLSSHDVDAIAIIFASRNEYVHNPFTVVLVAMLILQSHHVNTYTESNTTKYRSHNHTAKTAI